MIGVGVQQTPNLLSSQQLTGVSVLGAGLEARGVVTGVEGSAAPSELPPPAFPAGCAPPEDVEDCVSFAFGGVLRAISLAELPRPSG